MSVDAFADRLGRVRHRFVTTLESKIDDAYAAIAKTADATPAASAAVGETYRTLHGIVGIGPTVGFPATGRAAREAEDVLRAPYQQQRGLRADEVLQFKKHLHALREAANRELQFFYTRA
jgi:chemotaxis protein histidine kinase CheA